MLLLNEKEYSGKVISADDESLTLVIYTAERIEDVAPLMTDVTSITDNDSGMTTTYAVTAPLSFRVAASGMYVFEFSTKPTKQQEMDAQIQELSDAVDSLLVMVLEGE